MEYKDVSANTRPTVVRLRKKSRKGVVIHETIGTDSLAWLQGASASAGRPASSDFLITRVGDILAITRPGWYSFHAGKSRWKLVQDQDFTLNQSFVGIELENNPELGQKVTDAQYIALAALLRGLIRLHMLDYRNIVGHYEVALPHGRKTDPVTLDWSILTRELFFPSQEGREYKLPAMLP